MELGSRENVMRWVDAARSAGLVDSVEERGAVSRIRSGNKSLLLSWDGDNFAVVDEARPAHMVEVKSKAPISAVKVLSRHLFGQGDHEFDGKAYSGVSLYPRKVTNRGVEFETPSGRRWVCSSNEVRVTLGLYDLLYSANNESSILMMPMLYNEGTPSVQVQASVDRLKPYFFGIRSEFLSNRFTVTLGGLTVPPSSSGDVARINSEFGDRSVVGNKAPTLSSVIDSSDEMAITLKNQKLSMVASSMHDGIEYSVDAQGVMGSDRLTAVLEIEGSSYADLPYGVVVKDNRSKAILSSAYRGSSSSDLRSDSWIKKAAIPSSALARVASKYFPEQLAEAFQSGTSVSFNLG